MSSSNTVINSLLKKKVAECYSSQGFEVIDRPNVSQISFDLDKYKYCPDLLVKKSDNRGFIIGIEDRITSSLSIDRYSEIAKLVAKKDGWRFLLITGDDATPIAEDDIADIKLTRSQILHRKERIAKLISIGEFEAAFLALWIFAEVLMRRHSRHALLPIDRLPTMVMIDHLHNQSEISLDQYNRAIALNEIRNRVVHGFSVKALNLNEAIEKLLNLVDEFIVMQK